MPAHASASPVTREFRRRRPPRPVARLECAGRRAADVANRGGHRRRGRRGGGLLGNRLAARDRDGGRRHGRRVSRRRRRGPGVAVGGYRGGDGRRPRRSRPPAGDRPTDRVRAGGGRHEREILANCVDARAFPLRGACRHRAGRAPLADRRGRRLRRAATRPGAGRCAAGAAGVAVGRRPGHPGPAALVGDTTARGGSPASSPTPTGRRSCANCYVAACGATHADVPTALHDVLGDDAAIVLVRWHQWAGQLA